uniref:YggT family protein n=1 Tax=Strongyloides papillosus TaxID=174720 RepID=A0A0N5BFS6_STREA
MIICGLVSWWSNPLIIFQSEIVGVLVVADSWPAFYPITPLLVDISFLFETFPYALILLLIIR